MTEFFTTKDGLNLAYDIQGEGHPLLCLAGLTRNMADFEPVVEEFAGEARIIRLDTRGRGQSDRDPTYQNYNLVREAQDALELMDHLGLDKTSILGTSRGGLMAMGMAATVPERLIGAVLVDVGPVIEPVGLDYIMSYVGLPPTIRDPEMMAGALEHVLAPRFQNVPKETWRAMVRRTMVMGPEGLELSYDPKLRDAILEDPANVEPVDLWPFFDALAKLPCGLIRGANSDLLSEETTAEMRRRAPQMIFADVPDRGHVPFLDEPESIGVIRTYLEQVA